MKWNEDKGWGFLSSDASCEKDYWAEYRKLDKTPLGRVLTALRAGMVRECSSACNLNILDVGIGGGAFCDAMDCVGTDIDERALAWLKKEALDWDGEPVTVMTFWDSIEHIAGPMRFISKAREWVLLSTPIYESEAHALASKHFKPNEHLWYFTDRGIKRFMFEHGFGFFGQNELETDAGREGIGSYAFKRRD